MSVSNHRAAFRPLRGGIQILQGHTLEAGTLGLVLTQSGTDRWALTSRHVLARADGTMANGDPVLQPTASEPPIGVTDSTMANLALDCAAVLVDAAVGGVGDVLGIGALGPATAPVVGMRVMKSGWKTGITEGRIRSVTGSAVTIERLPTFPPAYRLAERGDSGAVWVEATSLAPVALHISEPAVGEHLANAVDLTVVIAALGVLQL